MFHRMQSKLVQYAIAVGATALVTAVRLLLDERNLIPALPFLLFAVAIAGAAWAGGWGPGLTATLLSWFAADFLLSRPRYQFHFYDANLVIAHVLFVVQGVLITWLGAARLKAIDSLSRASDELEHRVDDRTVQLKEAFEQIRHESAQRLQAVEQLEHESEERRIALVRLQESNRKLYVSNRELQDFASVASHDLQEPLRKIMAFGERLKARSGDALAPESRDYLQRMQNAAGRMQTLINDLLTFSRVTTKAQPFVPTDLGRIVHDVLVDLEARIEEQRATVEVGDLPTIDADALQMRQLFQNLIGNALKFNPSGQAPVVKVRAQERPDAGRVTLSVQDNGIGFDEKYLDRIFTVFQRLHGRGVYEGTGIGLAVCRKIVERHGGTITARSAPGQGATFIFDLPVRQGPPAPPPSPGETMAGLTMIVPPAPRTSTKGRDDHATTAKSSAAGVRR